MRLYALGDGMAFKLMAIVRRYRGPFSEKWEEAGGWGGIFWGKGEIEVSSKFLSI